MLFLKKYIGHDGAEGEIKKALDYQSEFPNSILYKCPLHVSDSSEQGLVLVERLEINMALSHDIRYNRHILPKALDKIFGLQSIRMENGAETFHPDFTLHNLFLVNEQLIVIDPFRPDDYAPLLASKVSLRQELCTLFVSIIENMLPQHQRFALKAWESALDRLENKGVLTAWNSTGCKIDLIKAIVNNVHYALQKRGVEGCSRSVAKFIVLFLSCIGHKISES